MVSKKVYPQGRSQTSVYQSWITRHAFNCFILMRYVRNISPKHSSVLNTRMILYVDIERVTSRKRIASGVAVRGDMQWCSWWRESCWCTKVSFMGKCTMPLMNINSDWMSNASSGQCIIYLYYAGPLSCTLGCNYYKACESPPSGFYVLWFCTQFQEKAHIAYTLT